MKKNILVIGIILMLIASLFILTGCGKKDTNSIVGSWEYESSSGYIYKFNDDKTGSYTAFGQERAFTYEDDGTKLTILYEGDTVSGSFEYRIEDNKLIIKDSFGKDVVYVKK